MARKRRSDRYQSQEYMPEMVAICRPTLPDKVTAHYIGKHSRYPESVQIKFGDGTSAIYELKVEQPAPAFASAQQKTFIGYAWKGAKT